MKEYRELPYVVRGEKSGVSALGLLFVLFVGLKLTGFITWSWWFVLFPVTIPLCLVVLALVAFAIVAVGVNMGWWAP